MSDDMVLKWRDVTVKGVDREARTVEGYASTEDVDYDGEVVTAGAWKDSLRTWKQKKSRPKFLAAHQHRLVDGHSPVIGGIDGMKIVKDSSPRGLRFKAWFADTDLGNEYLELYASGAMDAFSVGFYPMERVYEPKEIEKALKKSGIEVDPGSVRCVTTKAHILETSAVVVGCNMGALVSAAADGNEIAAKALDRLDKEMKIRPDGELKAVSDDPETEEKGDIEFDFSDLDDVPEITELEPENGWAEEKEPEPEPEPEPASEIDLLEKIASLIERLTVSIDEQAKEIKGLVGGIEVAMKPASKSAPKTDPMSYVLGDLAQHAERLKKSVGK